MTLSKAASLTTLACLIAGSAQVAPAQPPTSALNTPSSSDEATIGYSYSSKGDLDNGPKVGSTRIEHYDFSDRFEFSASPGLKLNAGVFWSQNDLSLTGPVPLPDRLTALGLLFGATQDLANVFGPGWSGLVMLRPGFFEGGSGFSSRGFDVPAVLMAAYRQSASLSLYLGVSVNLRSEYKVLPAAGVRWEFAPDWSLSAGFPETGVSYQASSDLVLKAGARFQGGSYYVKDALAPGLGDTRLEYREVRVGGGFDYKLMPNLTAKVDAGVVVNRRFNYYDRNYSLHGREAGYASLGLSARF